MEQNKKKGYLGSFDTKEEARAIANYKKNMSNNFFKFPTRDQQVSWMKARHHNH